LYLYLNRKIHNPTILFFYCDENNIVDIKVIEAAGLLIECLILKGDFYDALRFAAEIVLGYFEDSLNSFKCELDQESE
jgi:hypothetical protein